MFRYIPTTWVSEVNNLPDQGMHEVNGLNTALVQQLKSSDTAFSLGKSFITVIHLYDTVMFFLFTFCYHGYLEFE